MNLLVTNIGNGKLDPFLTEGEDLKFQRIFQAPLVGGKGGSEWKNRHRRSFSPTPNIPIPER